ncbi:MAG TPA: UDP-N-acetylmuramoyl-L-alanyl-D-glutamate--2,6-diaminopimelate ligase, partial [Alcanivorax sp.]|nr:UDP-N-acetylmuramoyl-L-alanyl-D-glutamate--2,6-diaminopimelate ligase [Alcanivorax sp.]
MMRLQQLLPEHNLPAQVAGLTISGLQLDSRRLQPGEVFVAVPGVASDGRHFIPQAISAGGTVVLAEAETFSVDLQ